MPAQTNATITQNMSDRQSDIDSMILSMILIHKCSIMAGCIFTHPAIITFSANYLIFSTSNDGFAPLSFSMPN